MRLIERDDETFLAWAKEPYACIIFNLRVEHSPAGLEKARLDFQKLIDLALDRPRLVLSDLPSVGEKGPGSARLPAIR